MLEAYEAFGDYETVLDRGECLLRSVATDLAEGGSMARPYGDIVIDWSKPFERRTYAELIEAGAGIDMHDETAVRAKAVEMGIEKSDSKDHWLLVEMIFDALGEAAIDPATPTYVVDFPSAVSPLSRPHEENPQLAYRSELFIAGMELGNFYTELNDPAIQEEAFSRQLAGEDDETRAFRTMDHDFIDALQVGMPPAGGFGIGVDRVVMLMTNSTSIRDVILFPLMRPE